MGLSTRGKHLTRSGCLDGSQPTPKGEAMKPISKLTQTECIARQRDIQARFAATRDNPEAKTERDELRVEEEVVLARIRELKEQTKAENMRRNFAGLDSPFHEAVKAVVDPVALAAFEVDAMARLAEREERSAAKKAARAAEAPAPVPPKETKPVPPPKAPSGPPLSRTISRPPKPQRHEPEVIIRRAPSRSFEVNGAFTEAQKIPRR